MFNYFKGNWCKRRGEIYTGNMKMIGFIVGTGRCGTTILSSVLNAHSRICVPHELHFIVHRGLYEKYLCGEAQKYGPEDFIHFIRERCPYNFDQYFDFVSHFKNLRYPQKDLSLLLTGLFDHICHSAGKEVLVEQTPWHGLYLNVLKELFPSMKIVHLIRDGRDVAISFARTPWWTKDVMANLERWGNEVDIAHKFCLENPDCSIELKYEDLVSQPEMALKRILNLFGLNPEEEMLNPNNLIDYFPHFKGDVMSVQSDQFKMWGGDKRTVFFPESVFGWKKNKAMNFSAIPEKISVKLAYFGYDV